MDGPFDGTQLFLAQRDDEGLQPSVLYGLQVIKTDNRMLGHTILIRSQRDYGGRRPNTSC